MKKVFENDKKECVTIDDKNCIINTDCISKFPVGMKTTEKELLKKGYKLKNEIY